MPHPPRPPLLPLDDALIQLMAHATPLDATESVAVGEADGRVLAQDVVSELHVPPLDNSAMDGYALRCADATAPGVTLGISQRIPAGASAQPLLAGTAARIFTGAPVPAGADAVIMQEDCTALPVADGGLGQVQVNSLPKAGQNIRRAGEDVARSDVVLSRGQRLGPAELGLAASIGMAALQVARRPRVALFSTGNELVMPGAVAPQDMPPGAIYNSNRYFLIALLRRLGCVVTDLGIVPDHRDATIQALRQAAKGHDLILTSGGVSVGEEDHIKPAVQSLGTLDLWQIAIKPGKPFAYGSIGDAHFMGLPGNPVASFVTFLVLVRPFLLRLQGVNRVAMKAIAAQANFTWARPDKRREFLRVRRNADGGLELFSNQSSGVLTSAVWGDGLIDNPPGCAIAPGDTVRFVPFSELLA
ncbi:MAG: molybdopterin molybdotransferase MoeA [Burkholderiales bacterium]|uniref:molybdopterin molybdotransferase MoeA n=1 Tax=Candidatus Aalborgicola defluviihabitans TaxID=3386187 RepID=UPI001D4CBC0E|nr:molybdopterin molybdotransferase MoeA [Burkholderiales bacterium]MBK6567286.1 molybdopterin molybdotransferase MoeA [Burkholderiales bacterium]